MSSSFAATRPTLPDASTLVELPHDRLAEMVAIHGDPAGNRVLVDRDFAATKLPNFEFHGTGNTIYFASGCDIRGTLRFHGAGIAAWFLGGHRILHLELTIYENGTLVWGRDSGSYGARVWVHGGRTLTIGDDCLFSEDIEIRTSDHHSVIDLATGEQINGPADVTIGRHVWLAAGVVIQKGVTIGDGSIVGARGVVVSPIPSAQAWAGVPARLVSDNVSWTDSHPADLHQAAAVVAAFGRGAG